MLRLICPLVRKLARVATLVAAGCALAACTAAPVEQAILVSTPTTAVFAVSTVGATNVRFLHVRGGSIVLLRTVFLPPGERVQSVTWSDNEREALIATSSEVLSLDTRTWRIGSIVRLAARAQDDARLGGRR